MRAYDARVYRVLRGMSTLALEHAPPWLLAVAARVTAPRATLRLQPGWTYGAASSASGRRAGVRRALWYAFRDRPIRRPVTVPWYDDLRVRLFLGNDLSFCVYVGGSIEPNEFVFLDRVLRPGMAFVDGGANDGLYSLFAARRVGLAGRVLAIEPSAREHARLVANLRLNGLENVTALQVALGASSGKATLAIASEGHEGQNTIGPRVSNPRVATMSHEHVAMETLDSLVRFHRLDRVDVVKLDVEGSEARVLEGAREVIERHRPLLLLEAEDERLASQGTSKDELLDLIAELGYRFHVFDETSGQLRPPRLREEPEGNLVAASPDWRPPAL